MLGCWLGLVLNRAVQISTFCAPRAGREMVFAGCFLAGRQAACWWSGSLHGRSLRTLSGLPRVWSCGVVV